MSRTDARALLIALARARARRAAALLERESGLDLACTVRLLHGALEALLALQDLADEAAA